MTRLYISLDDDGRIAATSPSFPCVESEMAFDFPPEFDVTKQKEYRIIDGTLVHAPLPVEPPVPTEAERLAALEAAVLELALGGALDG